MASHLLFYALVALKVLLPTDDGYTAGIKIEGDREIYNQIHSEAYDEGGKSKQLVSLYVPDMVITYINLQDLYGNKSGYADIIQGGIGKNSVGIKLYSEPGAGFKFHVEIRGLKIGIEHEAFDGKVGYLSHNNQH